MNSPAGVIDQERTTVRWPFRIIAALGILLLILLAITWNDHVARDGLVRTPGGVAASITFAAAGLHLAITGRAPKWMLRLMGKSV